MYDTYWLRNHSEAVTPVAAFFVFRLKERTPYNIQKKIQKNKNHYTPFYYYFYF